MADSSLMPALIGLAGTVAGTIMGFGGGLLTQLALEHRRQADARRTKKKEKLEELACELYAHEYWVYTLPNNVERGKDDIFTALAKLPPAPISKMLAISNVYFPELQEHIKIFSKQSAAHIHFIVRNGQQPFDASNKPFAQHIEAIKQLEDLIRSYAKRELQ